MSDASSPEPVIDFSGQVEFERRADGMLRAGSLGLLWGLGLGMLGEWLFAAPSFVSEISAFAGAIVGGRRGFPNPDAWETDEDWPTWTRRRVVLVTLAGVTLGLLYAYSVAR